jgi:platelet-activating factor acetylhydrolase
LANLTAIENAPPLKQHNTPAIVYSHGLGGTFDCYSVIAQDLASHGFIVICPNHNDKSAAISIFDDGRVIKHQKLTIQEKAQHEVAIRHQQLLHRVNEVNFVFSSLVEANKNKIDSLPHNILSYIDLDSIAVGGHSFGAATALTAAYHNKLFKSVILHDIWMLPLHKDVITNGINQPVLLMVSTEFERWKPNFAQQMALFKACKNDDKYSFQVRDTRHSNFVDLCLFSRTVARMLKQIGPLDVKSAFDLINFYDVTFLRAMNGSADKKLVEEKNNDIIWHDK